jgi:hypothetical protein
VYQPGESGNPNGRKPGTRNRRTQEILDQIKARGDKNPLVALSEIISTSDNPDHRISASNILAPYLHSKRGTIQAPRYVDDPIPVPEFANIQEAKNFLADIARRSGAGELELQSALDILALVKNWILSISARQDYELKLSAQGGGGEQVIRDHKLAAADSRLVRGHARHERHQGPAIDGWWQGPRAPARATAIRAPRSITVWCVSAIGARTDIARTLRLVAE